MMGCGVSRGWVPKLNHLMVRKSRKFSVAPLSTRAVSLVFESFMYRVKGVRTALSLFPKHTPYSAVSMAQAKTGWLKLTENPALL